MASLAAREVIVATLAQIYATEDEGLSLREAVRGFSLTVDPAEFVGLVGDARDLTYSHGLTPAAVLCRPFAHRIRVLNSPIVSGC